MRELLEQLRRERQDRLERYDLGGVYDEIAAASSTTSSTRSATPLDDACPRGARRAATRAARRLHRRRGGRAQLQLDMLPARPRRQGARAAGLRLRVGGGPAALRGADGPAPPAAHAAATSTRCRGAMQDMSPEDMQRMKDMLAELNEMLERARAGRGPRLRGVHGAATATSSPRTRRPSTSCSRVMAQRMAAMQAMLNSMTPEQRAQLQQLSDQLLEDMDLRWQMDQLGEQPAAAVPADGLGPVATTSRARTRWASPRPTQMMQRARRPRPAREPAARRRPTRARWPRPTSTASATCSATTPPAASSPGRAGQDARGGRPDRATRRAGSS